jgi:hypothetical protein
MLRAVLAQHSSHRDNRASKDARKTPRNNHLPQRLTHAEQRRRDRDSEERKYQDGFTSVAIGGLS